MIIDEKEKLLIISNNVLSTTRNNGKTIFSYINCLPKENVAQLYFSEEKPTISGYYYFQLSDRDIIRGLCFPQKRGRQLNASSDVSKNKTNTNNLTTKYRNTFFRIARDILWYRKWKSKKLLKWLDDFSPTAVFFVGGDSCFAYDIYRFVLKRYNPKSSLYITDDYITIQKKESFLKRIRKKQIKKKIKSALAKTNNFFTVSSLMRDEYEKIFERDSKTIVNLTESLKIDGNHSSNDGIVLLYAGSLYYGRDQMLGLIASTIKKFNSFDPSKKAFLKVYANTEPDATTKDRFVVCGCSDFCGSLSKEELKVALNEADVLVFVESFDQEQINKTRFSLSTKVPEYLSVGKPILALGPKGIGSIDYLSDVSCCVNDIDSLEKKLIELLNSSEIQRELAELALAKYNRLHDHKKLQSEFIADLFMPNE